MLVLALDTSMAACSVCVLDAGSGDILAANQAFMDKGQAEALAPMVEITMQQAGITFSQLGRVATTTGPGTFTGVRIGLAFARGLGVSLGIPVIGINSLSAIAANEKSGTHPVVVASDARGGDLYFATFNANGGELKSPAIVKQDAVANMLPTNPCIIVGTGADRLVSNGTHIRGTSGDLPLAKNFAHLAVDMAPPQFPPEPLYLRAPDVKLPITYTGAGAEASELLAAIHATSFDHPWDQASFSELLAGHSTSAIVAANQQTPTGFVLFRQAADEAEILTICTTPNFRRQGLAKALLRNMENQLNKAGTKSLFIEVAISNLAAISLYASCGFQNTGLRKNYYERANGTREDAHIMRKGLSS